MSRLKKTNIDKLVEKSIYKKEKHIEERDENKEKKIRVFGYCRVSTQMQAEDGDSLDAQESRIKEYCIQRGLELVGVFKECMSGAIHYTARPLLGHIIREMKSGKAEGLVVYKLDRLSRSIKDTIELISNFSNQGFYFFEIKNNIETSTATGRFTLHLFSALAELERSTISERVKEVINYKRDNNMLLGGVPFGKKVEEKEGMRLLVDDEIEQQTIGMILEMREQTRRLKNGKIVPVSLQQICEMLKNEDRKNKDGRALWFPSQIKRILKQNKKFDLKDNKEDNDSISEEVKDGKQEVECGNNENKLSDEEIGKSKDN